MPEPARVIDFNDLSPSEKETYQTASLNSQKDDTCYKCLSKGHFARDCTNSSQIKQAVAFKPKKPEFNKKDKPKFKSNWSKDKNKKKSKGKYWCPLCKVTSHSLNYCRIYKEAKRIINGQTTQARTYFANIASSNPLSQELEDLSLTMSNLLTNNDDNLDIPETLQTLYACSNLWDGSEVPDSSSDSETTSDSDSS